MGSNDHGARLTREELFARLEHEFVMHVACGYDDPGAALDRIVQVLHWTTEPDDELCLLMGAGDLETLIRRHGEELWPRVETLAREDVRFRRALRNVWASESPEFERRDALLTELGEWRPTTVRFVAYQEDFGGDRYEWRALALDASVPKGALAALLRDIAASLEDRSDDAADRL